MYQYLSFLYPAFQGIIYHTSTKPFKHFTRFDFSAKFESLVANGKRSFGLGLLGTDANTITLIGCNTEIRPLQVHNIADT